MWHKSSWEKCSFNSCQSHALLCAAGLSFIFHHVEVWVFEVPALAGSSVRVFTCRRSQILFHIYQGLWNLKIWIQFLPLLSSSSFKKLTFFFSSSKSHEIILNDMVFYRSTLLQERINISRRRTLDIYIGRWRQWELTFSSEEVEIANREKLE